MLKDLMTRYEYIMKKIEERANDRGWEEGFEVEVLENESREEFRKRRRNEDDMYSLLIENGVEARDINNSAKLNKVYEEFMKNMENKNV